MTLEILLANINTYEPTYVASNYDIEEEKLIVMVDGLYVDFARDVSFISKMIPHAAKEVSKLYCISSRHVLKETQIISSITFSLV